VRGAIERRSAAATAAPAARKQAANVG
jgi:hypothetical protein